MSTSLSSVILALFSVSCLTFLILLFKQGRFSQLKFQASKSEGQTFGIAVISIGALLGLRAFISPGDDLIDTSLFLVALTLPFFLKRLQCTEVLLQVVLLILVVVMSVVFSKNLAAPAYLATLLGLITYKILENLLFSTNNRLDDIAPACTLLAFQSWFAATGSNDPDAGNILISCFSISLLLEMVPSALLDSDRFFLKRLALALSGGLGLLIILSKVLLLQNLGWAAALFASGIFFVYFFANAPAKQEEDFNRLSYCLQFLVALGILTVAATRLFGDLGLIVLLSTSLLSGSSNRTLLASIFWSSRLLLQAFVSTYVANVTGINLMHPYCTAALYFGFLAILFLLAVIHINSKSRLVPLALLVTSILLPPAIIYLLHEESAASFLIAALVSTVSLVGFFPVIYKGADLLPHDNLMLVPMLMATMALLYGPLVTIGNEATVANRMQLLSITAGVLLIFYLLLLAITRFRSTGKPVSISGDQS
jgi:hypothetical protein